MRDIMPPPPPPPSEAPHYLHLKGPSNLSSLASRSKRLDFHSQKTLPTSTSNTVNQDLSQPCHPVILRSSCSLPPESLQDFALSDAIVHRQQSSRGGKYSSGRSLPQYESSRFVILEANQLPAEETRRLNLMLEITSASVRDPAVFAYLLQQELRVCVDPVSQTLRAPGPAPARWTDGLSLASTSTCASLNTSVVSEAAGELLSSEPSGPPAPPLRSAIGHWKAALADCLRSPIPGAIPRETRQSVVTWMSKVIEAMGWSLNAFFTAVHAMDYSLKTGVPGGAARPLPDASVPLLSTACVLVGVSAESEHRQLQKARAFVGQVPHVSSVKEIVCKQLAIVANLDRGTLLHKTPLDFALYYLASWRLHSAEIERHRLHEAVSSHSCSLWDKLFRLSFFREPSGRSGLLPLLLQERPRTERVVAGPMPLVELLLDGALSLAVHCYLDAVHTHLPLSRLVAGAMFAVLSCVEESFRDVDFCTGFCRRVFALDYLTELLPVLTDLLPLITATISRSNRLKPIEDSDSTFTAWSPAARLMNSLLEQCAAHGAGAFPHF